jgi:hypothetical protein
MPIDAAHLHLMVNHSPVILSIVAMASLAVGAVGRRDFYMKGGAEPDGAGRPTPRCGRC